ncbi:MAG TPA: hypothetical protein VMT00_09665 [Thermoanaerobaculia bacterium]|nr:hypothetical protein [Thermoanaerobaculia bacterium]
MRFRDRLLSSLKAMQPVLDIPGVMIGGSQVPNLLQPEAASTLVVSQDVDLVIPVAALGEVKDRLSHVEGYSQSIEEPSVWLADAPARLEVNFIGRDPALGTSQETYVLEDLSLPLLVFGLLSHLSEGPPREIEGVRVPLPRPAGLLLEKLLTERSGIKGDRDLLVALGLLLVSSSEDLGEADDLFDALPEDEREMVRSNLAVLSLMQAMDGMPDPETNRSEIARFLKRIRKGR